MHLPLDTFHPLSPIARLSSDCLQLATTTPRIVEQTQVNQGYRADTGESRRLLPFLQPKAISHPPCEIRLNS